MNTPHSPADQATDRRTLGASVADLMPRAIADLAELVAIPSIADERVMPLSETVRAAEWVREAFRAEGIPAELEVTPDGTHAVIGHRPGPAGSPTVLLYCHYDVQPILDEEAWLSPPFTLTERDGRLYGRGAADCKGNLVAHLTALRALRERAAAEDTAAGGSAQPAPLTGDSPYPVGIIIVAEGSEEQGRASLDQYAEANPELFRQADVMLIQDAGNARAGLPTLTTTLRGAVDVVVRVSALEASLHSGAFGGAAPDALAALVQMLATLRDAEGNTTIQGVDASQTWAGLPYEPEAFRSDAGMLPGTRVLGSGSVAEQVWARPALTILGIDAPPVVGAVAAIQPRAAAKLNLRVPPGADAATLRDALIAHLHAVAPWGVTVEAEAGELGHPFSADTSTHAFQVLSDALTDAYDGVQTVTSGQGGSIPLTTTLAGINPEAAIMLLGVLEPECRMHSTNESVLPDELQRIALAEALFLSRLAGSVQG